LQPGEEVVVDMPADDTCSGAVARGCKNEPTVFSPKKLSKKECAATPGRLRGRRPFPKFGKWDEHLKKRDEPLKKRDEPLKKRDEPLKKRGNVFGKREKIPIASVISQDGVPGVSFPKTGFEHKHKLFYNSTLLPWSKTLLLMARCKNTPRSAPTSLPRAVFPARKECEVCGLLVTKSNLARHKKFQHAKPGRFVTPRASPHPSPVARVSPLVIRLPAVDRAVVDHCPPPKPVVERELPTTPESDEDLLMGLAKLYAGRVQRVTVSTIGYVLTKEISAVARDPTKRGELQEIMSAAGLVLLTQDELTTRVQEASAKALEC